MANGNHSDWKVGATGPGLAHVFEDHKIHDQITAMKSGEPPISETLKHIVFGQISWPVALGRPSGKLADAFNVAVTYDDYVGDDPNGAEIVHRIQTPCVTTVVDGQSDETTFRVNFASTVPTNADPPREKYPVYSHIDITIRDEASWSHPGGPLGIAQAGTKRVYPNPTNFLKHDGPLFLEFEVVPGLAPVEHLNP